MPVVGLNHYNLQAPRALLEQLRRFYCEAVGLVEGPRPPFRSFGSWLSSGDQPILHLSESRAGEERRTDVATTFDHAAFSCTGRAEFEHSLAALGVAYRVLTVPQTSQVQLVFRDPAGNGVELNFVEAVTRPAVAKDSA